MWFPTFVGVWTLKVCDFILHYIVGISWSRNFSQRILCYHSEVRWQYCKCYCIWFNFFNREKADHLKIFAFCYFQVDVVNRTAHADLTNYTPNGEWTLAESPSLIRRVKTYSNLPEPFPEIVITFHIRRKTLYYMYNIGNKGPV